MKNKHFLLKNRVYDTIKVGDLDREWFQRMDSAKNTIKLITIVIREIGT